MVKSILIGKQILIASLAFTLVLGTVSTVDATSRNAFDKGYQDGRNDAKNGNSKNSYCDPDNSDSNPDLYCGLYKSGYEAGWLAYKGLYGNQ